MGWHPRKHARLLEVQCLYNLRCAQDIRQCSHIAPTGVMLMACEQCHCRVWAAASDRWGLARYFVRKALETLPHTFDPTDRLLLHHGSLLADAYDLWFQKWSSAQNVR